MFGLGPRVPDMHDLASTRSGDGDTDAGGLWAYKVSWRVSTEHMEASSGEHTRNEDGIGMTLITGINNHTPGASCFHEPVRAVDRMALSRLRSSTPLTRYNKISSLSTTIPHMSHCARIL